MPAGVAAARLTGRLTIRTDAVVERITVDERTSLADGAVFIDRLTRRQHRVFADVVVLCASTIESIRLMLNSACGRYPDGLGNSGGLLGRYFMDQTISLAFCSVPQFPGYSKADTVPPADPFYPPTGGILIPRYENMGPEPEKGFARGTPSRAPVAASRFRLTTPRPSAWGAWARCCRVTTTASR